MDTVQTLKTDYLIIGSGATGMGFADVILHETNANIIIIDRHDWPGGHWNDAYPFVRLHQPARYYGVNSRKLGTDSIDKVGPNKGLYELVSGAEVLSYFDEVMNQQFLPSGRVQYFPMCDYVGNNEFISRISGKHYQVEVRKKIVNATYLNPQVPSTHAPRYHIAPEVECIPINELPHVSHTHTRYVVVGSGKTGIDACLWLLEKKVDPDKIYWIMPRDAWMFDRRKLQSGDEFFFSTFEDLINLLNVIIQAESIDDFFCKIDENEIFFRIDKNVKPTMFHCATITKADLKQMRKIKNIIRMGHVKSITKNSIILDHGIVPADPNYLYIDCTAEGIPQRPIVPVFQGNTITPQILTGCAIAFSSAFTAHVEATYRDDDKKNKICSVIKLPNSDIDLLRVYYNHFTNMVKWSKNNKLRKWILSSRLDFFSGMLRGIRFTNIRKILLFLKVKRKITKALPKLHQLIKEADSKH